MASYRINKIFINMFIVYILNYYFGQCFGHKLKVLYQNKKSTCLSNGTNFTNMNKDVSLKTCESEDSNFWILSLCQKCERTNKLDVEYGNTGESFREKSDTASKEFKAKIGMVNGNLSEPDQEEIEADKEFTLHKDKFNFTFVSALFDLHREKWPKFKRKYDQYLNYSIQLLQMNVPLVAFVDSTAEAFVWSHRQHKRNITKIIVTSLDKLEYYEDYEIIKSIMNSDQFKTNHTFLHHPEGFSPEYNILMNSKFSMMYHAAKENYFNSSHIYWIDMGYGHGSDVFPKSKNWAPRNLMYNESISDKITYIQINNMKLLYNIYQIYKRDVPPFLSGGFFGGSKAAVEHYYFIHREMFKLFLRHKMIDDDQTLAILCYFKEQTLFNFVDGWWYDAFKLFN